jgi:hypothetical protein
VIKLYVVDHVRQVGVPESLCQDRHKLAVYPATAQATHIMTYLRTAGAATKLTSNHKYMPGMGGLPLTAARRLMPSFMLAATPVATWCCFQQTPRSHMYVLILITF